MLLHMVGLYRHWKSCFPENMKWIEEMGSFNVNVNLNKQYIAKYSVCQGKGGDWSMLYGRNMSRRR